MAKVSQQHGIEQAPTGARLRQAEAPRPRHWLRLQRGDSSTCWAGVASMRGGCRCVGSDDRAGAPAPPGCRLTAAGTSATRRFPRTYDFISAWDSIWHLPLSRPAPVLRRVLRQLTLGGVCSFAPTVALTAHPEKVIRPWGRPCTTARSGSRARLRVLSDGGCVCRHLEYDQPPELHLHVIAQKG